MTNLHCDNIWWKQWHQDAAFFPLHFFLDIGHVDEVHRFLKSPVNLFFCVCVCFCFLGFFFTVLCSAISDMSEDHVQAERKPLSKGPFKASLHWGNGIPRGKKIITHGFLWEYFHRGSPSRGKGNKLLWLETGAIFPKTLHGYCTF